VKKRPSLVGFGNNSVNQCSRRLRPKKAVFKEMRAKERTSRDSGMGQWGGGSPSETQTKENDVRSNNKGPKETTCKSQHLDKKTGMTACTKVIRLPPEHLKRAVNQRGSGGRRPKGLYFAKVKTFVRGSP